MYAVHGRQVEYDTLSQTSWPPLFADKGKSSIVFDQLSSMRPRIARLVERSLYVSDK